MLRFQAKWIDPILSGDKVQTLRRRVSHAVMCAPEVDAGSDYRHPPFARLAITKVDQVNLCDLTAADARREGLASLEELQLVLATLYAETPSLIRVRFTVAKVPHSA